MKLIMESWRQFINEKRLPGGAPSKSKLKKVAQILGRPLSKGEVVALDKKFHQTFPIAAQMQVWLAVDPNGRPLLYDDMPEACKWARISCPSPEPEPQPEPEPEEEPQEQPQEEPEEEEEEEEYDYQDMRYKKRYGFSTKL